MRYPLVGRISPTFLFFMSRAVLIFAFFGDFNSARYKRLLAKKHQRNYVEFSSNFLYNSLDLAARWWKNCGSPQLGRGRAASTRGDIAGDVLLNRVADVRIAPGVLRYDDTGV